MGPAAWCPWCMTDWATCEQSCCQTDGTFGEEFWNCADIAVLSGPKVLTPPPTPTPRPDDDPTSPPTPRPSPDDDPTSPPTPKPSLDDSPSPTPAPGQDQLVSSSLSMAHLHMLAASSVTLGIFRSFA